MKNKNSDSVENEMNIIKEKRKSKINKKDSLFDLKGKNKKNCNVRT